MQSVYSADKLPRKCFAGSIYMTSPRSAHYANHVQTRAAANNYFYQDNVPLVQHIGIPYYDYCKYLLYDWSILLYTYLNSNYYYINQSINQSILFWTWPKQQAATSGTTKGR